MIGSPAIPIRTKYDPAHLRYGCEALHWWIDVNINATCVTIYSGADERSLHARGTAHDRFVGFGSGDGKPH